MRQDYPWMDQDTTVLLSGADGHSTWRTFGSVRANAALANEVGQLLGTTVDHDSPARRPSPTNAGSSPSRSGRTPRIAESAFKGCRNRRLARLLVRTKLRVTCRAVLPWISNYRMASWPDPTPSPAYRRELSKLDVKTESCGQSDDCPR